MTVVNTIRVAFLAVFMTNLLACTTIEYKANPHPVIYFNESFVNHPLKPGTTRKTKNLTLRTTADFYLWGFAPAKRVINVSSELQKYTTGYISNITIKEKRTLLDMTLFLLTLGIYTPVSVEIRADTNERKY